MSRHPIALLLTVLALLLAACDQECVSNCPDDDDDATEGDDDDVVVDDDDDDATMPPTDEVEAEIIAIRDCTPLVRHAPLTQVSSVQIAGEWNGWVAEDMEGPDDDGVFSFELPELAPGEYGHKFLYGGDWEGDPPAWAYAKWVDGSENRNLRIGDCNLPLLQTVQADADADGTLTATIQFARAADDSPVDPATVAVQVGGQDVTAQIDAATGLIEIEVTGLADGKHSVLVRAADEAGRDAENEPLWIPLWVEDQRFSWEDALIYFAFTDRFRNSDWEETPLFDPVPDVLEIANFQGGDFYGIIQAMEEGWFEALGVNVLWLTPVYENPEGAYLAVDQVHNFSGFHGYWPVNAWGVEARSGDVWVDSEERLHELIDKAHERGIRVMFDLVLNHVHEDHDYVADHPEWFGGGCVCGQPGCSWDDHPLDCWFTDYLPDLDYRNHWVTMQVLEDTLAMLRVYDVDAVRVDAAKHMDHVVMRSLSRRLREEVGKNGGAPFYLVGETFTGGDGHGLIMDYVNPWELTGQFDFPLFYSIRSSFGHGNSFNDLDGAVSTCAAAYGDGLMAPFAGNHDIPRFATEIAGNDDGSWGFTEDWMAGGGDEITQQDIIDKMSMAFAFTLTQPGAPLLYYGDEIGLAGSGDPDNRRMMSFEPYLSANQTALLERVRAIGTARAGSRAIRRGERSTLWVDDDLYVYSMDAGDGDVAVIAMNKAWTPRVESVDLDASLDGEIFHDATQETRMATVEGGDLAISLEAWDYAIFVR
jgi:glycosidase